MNPLHPSATGKLLAGLLLLAALAGCGGSSGSTPAGVPYDQAGDDKAAAAVAAAWNASAGQSSTAQAQAVLAAMQADPQFASSGISSDNTVWGIFKDGTLFAVDTNDLDATVAASAQDVRPRLRDAAATPKAGELPGSAKAYVFNALEPARGVPDQAIADNLLKAGYTVVYATGSLTDWQSVADAGLMFSAAHGIPLPFTAGQPEEFFLEASDVYTPGDTTWAAQIHAGQLGTYLLHEYQAPIVRGGPLPGYIEETHYIMRSTFLTRPGMFSANSLLVSEACDSLSTAGRAFASSLGALGLSVMGGWSKENVTLDANETSSFFFDRALGLNAFAPVDPGNPPPMDLASILTTMQNTSRASGAGSSLNISNLPNSLVSVFSFQDLGGSGLTTLIPSIATTAVDVAAGTLTLQGSFGSDQGTVNLDTTALTVQSWAPDAITCAQPSAASGNLQVLSPLGLKSNLSPYSALLVQILPAAPTLNPGDAQTFTVSATAGTLPAGASYQWSLTGNGSIGASPTTVPSIGYTAGAAGTDVLSVQVLDASSTLLAKASRSIKVQGNPFLGTWVGSVTSTCGYYSGQLTITITATGGDGLLFSLNNGFGSYAGTYAGNTATSYDGSVVFTVSGTTLTAVESNSCQTGVYYLQ